MGKHFFHESTDKFGEFYRVIYCEWCGLVVFNWNANHNTTPSLKDYLDKAETSCVANTGKPTNKDKQAVKVKAVKT